MIKAREIIKELEDLDILYKATEDMLLRGELAKRIVQNMMLDTDKQSFKIENIKHVITENRSVAILRFTAGVKDDKVELDESYFKENPLVLSIGATVTRLSLLKRNVEYFDTYCYDLEMDIEFNKNTPIIMSLVSIVDSFEESTRGTSKGTSIAFGLEIPELVAKSHLITKLNIRKAIETYMYDQEFKELDVELRKDCTELCVFYRMYPELEKFNSFRRKCLGRPIDSAERLVLTPSDITDYGQGVPKTIPVNDKNREK